MDDRHQNRNDVKNSGWLASCERFEMEMELKAGDEVVVTCNHEGYNGNRGVVIAVFPSGRCQVSVGKIALLNLPPEGIERINNG